MADRRRLKAFGHDEGRIEQEAAAKRQKTADDPSNQFTHDVPACKLTAVTGVQIHLVAAFTAVAVHWP